MYIRCNGKKKGNVLGTLSSCTCWSLSRAYRAQPQQEHALPSQLTVFLLGALCLLVESQRGSRWASVVKM